MNYHDLVMRIAIWSVLVWGPLDIGTIVQLHITSLFLNYAIAQFTLMYVFINI